MPKGTTVRFTTGAASLSGSGISSHKAMSTPKGPPSSFKTLSIELVEWILLFTSARDILRSSLVRSALFDSACLLSTLSIRKVNRTFRKLVQRSPSIHTKSTCLQSDYNVTHGSRHLSPIAVLPLHRIADFGTPWAL